ncbi:helix-turn-helix transcriptional regulator [Chitinophaga varians]|uniref:Helix-turn-helix transcriptional regulator n=1 Tax=Chitinophaga varians TaxID=2202339 RepID=A0A847RUX7_9BACT|nr:helix-turn-helix transcriptional regulator [Chitinophaga varians]NLR65694.1 helix-turn-helix transcriptional regulator [Chitinophaga varians]
MEIIELASGERKSVIITETQKSDLKNLTEEKFFFNWRALEGGSIVYQLQLKEKEGILGVMGLIDFPDEARVAVISGRMAFIEHCKKICFMYVKKGFSKKKLEEVADDVVMTEKLSPAQEVEARKQLAAARKKTQAGMTEQERLIANLLQLKFRLEEYIDNREFDDKLTFGYFLKEYLQLIHKKRNEFAAEIDIHETLLSQLINNHRAPSESVIIRLELHSNNAIPATYWYRLVEKQKEHFIGTNKELRKMEKKFVKNPLRISI